MERLIAWINWLFADDRWRLVLIPPFLLLAALLILHDECADNNPLRNRQVRTQIYEKLLAEMEGLDLPPNSAINSTDAKHKASLILITRKYRSVGNRREFLDSIHGSLGKLGWIGYPGEPERIALRTYRYCRGDQHATLYLLSKGIFDSDPGDYWSLSFSMGVGGPGVGLFGSDPRPSTCYDN